MNTFYTIFKIFLFSYCTFSIRTEHSNSTLNIDLDNENVVHCASHVQAHEIKYIWTIRNVSAHEKIEEGELSSPKLRALTTDKVEWDLRLDLKWYSCGKEHILLKASLSSESVVKYVQGECTISIINRKKEVLLQKHIQSERYSTFFIRSFYFTKDNYFRNHLLQNDTLTMAIHLKWFFEPSHNVSQNTTTTKGSHNFFLKLCKNLHKKIF